MSTSLLGEAGRQAFARQQLTGSSQGEIESSFPATDAATPAC